MENKGKSTIHAPEYTGHLQTNPIQKMQLTAAEENILKMAKKIQQNQEQDRAFTEKLSRFLDESQPHTNAPIEIGVTPYSLVIAGADENLPVVINPQTIIKCMDNPDEVFHGHELSREIMEQLPRELRNPALILKGSHEGSLVAVTELKDNEDRNVIIAVQLDSRQARQEVNRITSAYGKDNIANYLDNQINANGNLVAANIEKADEMLQSLGLQLPPEETFISFNSSITYTTANVKYPKEKLTKTLNLQNPKEVSDPQLDKDSIYHATEEYVEEMQDTSQAENMDLEP